MSTPVIGRNAAIAKGGVTIGFAKGVTVGIDFGKVKDYAMGSSDPAILEFGEATYKVSVKKMWVDNAWATEILAKTKVTVIVYPAGSIATKPKITLSNVVFNSWELSAEQDGIVLENAEGEGKTLALGTV